MTVDGAVKEDLRKRIIKAKDDLEQKNGKSLKELLREKDQRMADAT